MTGHWALGGRRRRFATVLPVLLAAILLALVGVACQSTTAASQPAATATPRGQGGAATAPKPAQPEPSEAKPRGPKPADGRPADIGPSDGRSPSGKPNDSQAPAPKPGGTADEERERLAARATWAPGSLESHFEKHGGEGPYRSAAEYDRAARDTIRNGTAFAYQDRESNAERRGFYDKAANRFTGVTRDGARITTHFRPNRGEAYVRGLEDSTYR